MWRFPPADDACVGTPVGSRATEVALLDGHLLVQRARWGACDAWRSLVDRSVDPAFRLAWLLLPDEVASQACVEAFVRAARRLEREGARGSFFGLVAREVVRRARQARVSSRTAAPLASGPETPDARALLRALPADDAATLALRLVLNVPEHEAMEVLGDSRRELERRMARALRRLRGLSVGRRPVGRTPGAAAGRPEAVPDWAALAASLPGAPPDLGERIVQALQSAPRRRIGAPRSARVALAAAAMTALGFGTAVGLLATWDAAREWLRVGPSAVPTAVPPPSPTALPTPTAVAVRGFARPVTLDEARRLAPFPLMFPQGWQGPDAIYLWEPQAGNPVVILSYLDGGFDLYEGPLAATFDESPVEIARVEVNGTPARWLEGGAIVLHYLDPAGNAVVERKRILERNTLVWERSGVTLRLETSRALPFALAIAGAVR